MFDQPHAQIVEDFCMALRVIGLTGVVLYQLRHGGASDEIITGDRSVEEVRRRGRWKSEASVRRYSKPSMLHRLLGKLSPQHLEFGGQAWIELPSTMGKRSAKQLPVGIPWTSSDARSSFQTKEHKKKMFSLN